MAGAQLSSEPEFGAESKRALFQDFPLLFRQEKVAQTQTFGSGYLPVEWGSST